MQGARTTRTSAGASSDNAASSASAPIIAQAMLSHSRAVSLFLQGRRLHDHYRFQERADRWVATRGLRPCFFPISYNERQQNPLAPQPAQDRPAACQ